MEKILSNPYLLAARSGLTLTLPVVMAGSLAVLVNKMPLPWYQNLMASLWGEGWHSFGDCLWNATFGVLSFFMVYTISHSITEQYNLSHPLRPAHPNIVGLVSFASLMALMQPAAEVFAIPYLWAGIHGMFLAVTVAFASSWFFLRLFRIPAFRIPFHSEEADASVPHAFSTLAPGFVTVLLFSGIKFAAEMAGVSDIHRQVYDFLRHSFRGMENTLTTALIYNVVRHIFWFFGLHGSNILEPAMMMADMPAVADVSFTFSRTFFDVFVSMGGSGSTLCMIIACRLFARRGGLRKIIRLSFLPALFNINEMMMFGVPIVFNPIYLIPFTVTPLVLTLTSWAAMRMGLVPLAANAVSWTTPVLISGYAATQSFAGVALQVVNVALGVGIYAPFVRFDEREKNRQFERTFRELTVLAEGGALSAPTVLISRHDEAGALARSLVSDLADALRSDSQIRLVYQPQVNCYTGAVTGVEALIRWEHPRVGSIPPSVLIAVAEDSGLIQEVGRRVLEEACRQLKSWRESGLVDLVMSVNVSVRQLSDPAFPDQVAGTLARYGIPPRYLEIEVTESVALSAEGEDGHGALLQKLHVGGVRLAIDDFGMGHSSLVYLKRFPADTLKIDRSLSRDVLTKDGSAEIIMAIAELCRTLDISMIVEYVETTEQLSRLKSLGAVSIQGYLYSRPLPPDECRGYILRGADSVDEENLIGDL